MDNFSVRGTAEDGNIVTFYNHKVQNNFKSKQEEKPVYDILPYIQIVSPGQRRSTVERKATADDKIKYSKHWEAFEKKEQLRGEGTPLVEWNYLEKEMIAELEYHNIYTVENLAEAADVALQGIGPGIIGLRNEAKNFLAKDPDADVKLRDALAEIEELKAIVNKLTGANEAIPAVSEMEEQDELTIGMSGRT